MTGALSPSGQQVQETKPGESSFPLWVKGHLLLKMMSH